MGDQTDGGWFSYSPVDPTSWERLSLEQRGTVLRHRQERTERAPVGEVRILFRSLQPGQAELRIGSPPGQATTADVIRAAIRELESVLTLFGD